MNKAKQQVQKQLQKQAQRAAKAAAKAAKKQLQKQLKSFSGRHEKSSFSFAQNVSGGKSSGNRDTVTSNYSSCYLEYAC